MNCLWLTIIVGVCLGVGHGTTSVSSSELTDRPMPQVIVDLDIGLDDYLAVLELLYAEKLGLVKIVAIVCTSGNTNVTNVVKNAVRMLNLVNRTDIPLYKGVDDSIIYHKPFEFWYGKDGFGDLTHSDVPDMSIVKGGLAARVIRNLVVNNPKKYTLLALAPPTNVALTTRLYSDYLNNLKELWILGGNYNFTTHTEFNFLYDPEAAHMIFDINSSVPIYLLTQETFVASIITYDWRYNVLGGHTPAMKYLLQAEQSVNHSATSTNWIVADQLLAFCLIHPESCSMNNLHNVDVNLHDPNKRAWIKFDVKNNTKNVRLIDSVDTETFKNFLIDVGNNV